MLKQYENNVISETVMCQRGVVITIVYYQYDEKRSVYTEIFVNIYCGENEVINGVSWHEDNYKSFQQK